MNWWVSARAFHRSTLLVLAQLGSVTLLAGCRNPAPPARDPPGIQPAAPDPGHEEPAIEPDTGDPIGPSGDAN